MLAVIRAVWSGSFCSRVLLLANALFLTSNLAYSAPATVESKTEIKAGIKKKSISTPLTTKIQQPSLNKNVLRLKTIKPALRPAGTPPVPPPAGPGSPSPSPSSTPPPSGPSPDPSTRPASEAVPETIYEEPRYEHTPEYYNDGGYGQDYEGGGNYYPDDSGNYYQEPAYTEPSPQLFRGVGGSLLNQQQFNFKPLSGTPTATTQAGAIDSEAHEPGQVLVATVSMDEAKQLQRAVANAGYRPKSRTNLSQLGFVLTIFRLPAGVSVLDAVGQLKEAFPGFLVNANTRYSPLAMSGDKKNYAKPLIQWGSSSVQCGNKVKIGLLDTNVDSSHDQLIAANIKTSTVLPAGLGSKKTDHGTAIANLLVGSKQGLLPGAELFAVDVFRNTNDKLDTTTAWILKAINDLLEKKVSIINFSLGGERDELLEYVSKTVFEKQVLMVAAAGNSGPGGKPMYPAAYPEVIAVTAVDAGRKIYSKANSGEYIDLAAPGVDVWSASSASGRYYTGTSFAVPYVTAALAVLRANMPSASAAQIRSRLLGKLEDLGKKGKDAIYGNGLLNARGLCKS